MEFKTLQMMAPQTDQFQNLFLRLLKHIGKHMDHSIRSKNEKMTPQPVKPLQMALKHLRHGMAGRAMSSTHTMSFIHGVA